MSVCVRTRARVCDPGRERKRERGCRQRERRLIHLLGVCLCPSLSLSLSLIVSHNENSSGAVLSSGQLWKFLETTVSICQGCLLPSILFNLFLENIMQKTLYDHHTANIISGRPICNLRFTDGFDLVGGSNGQLQDLTNKLQTKQRRIE